MSVQNSRNRLSDDYLVMYVLTIIFIRALSILLQHKALTKIRGRFCNTVWYKLKRVEYVDEKKLNQCVLCGCVWENFETVQRVRIQSERGSIYVKYIQRKIGIEI